MRRYMTTICVVGLMGVGGAAVASAARPAPNRSFSGTGANSWNRGGTWVRHGTGSFRFNTSKKFFFHNKPYWYLNNFRGSYTTSCHSSTLHVSATNIFVNSRGDYSFSFNSHGAHVTIWGSFTSRRTAKVNYLVKFSSSCQTRVRGTAFAG